MVPQTGDIVDGLCLDRCVRGVRVSGEGGVAGRDTGVLTVGKTAPSLVRWGVSTDADLVYRCLVSFGPQRVGVAAADLGLPVRRVRTALDELVEAGLVQSARGSSPGIDGMLWRAVPPDAAVSTLRVRALRRAAGHATAGHAAGRDRRARPSFAARRLPDRATTRRRVAELVAGERVEHLAMHPEQAFSAAALAAASPLDIAILKRGVRLRALGRPPADGDRSAQHTAELTRLGGEYRETAQVPHKLMIFDRRVALLAVDPTDLDRGTWEVADPAAVESLVTLFVRHWSGAKDPGRNGVPTIVLTSREKAITALLAQGCTDATAAQHLGISTRSVTYTLRALMDRLGVENRFQLGLALGALNAAVPPGLSIPDAGDSEV